MSDDSKFGRSTKMLLSVAAAIAFAATIYLLIEDKTGSATIAGGFTFGLLVFVYLPVFESFEVLGLKARLSRRIDEAERLLGHIRRSAEVSSRLLYIQLAWMNRLGNITWSKKRELLAEIDRVLIELGLSQEEVLERKRPFLLMTSLDLLRVFEQTLDARVTRLRSYLQDEQHRKFKGASVNPSNPEWHRLLGQIGQLKSELYDAKDILSDVRLENIGKFCREKLEQSGLPDEERGVMEQVVKEVSTLSEKCWAAGTIIQEAEHYLDEYEHPADRRYKEIFEKS